MWIVWALYNIGFVQFADIDECSSNPCQNGAACQQLVDIYNCTCSGGYNGTNCEIGTTR